VRLKSLRAPIWSKPRWIDPCVAAQMAQIDSLSSIRRFFVQCIKVFGLKLPKNLPAKNGFGEKGAKKPVKRPFLFEKV